MVQCAGCTVLHNRSPQKTRSKTRNSLEHTPTTPQTIMATPRKTAAGTWRVEIEVKGKRDSATLPTKREAVEWAARRRLEMAAGASGDVGTVKTLADAMRDYADKVAPKHRGERAESIRLLAMAKHPTMPVKKRLSDITPADLVVWRDARLRVTERGTVLRDMTLLALVFEAARSEWGWIKTNPMREVKRPAQPDHRERVIAGVEVRAMLRQLGHKPGGAVRSVSQAVAMAFLMALSSGMRAGEICSLRWDDVHDDWVRLPMTKNGKARNVPLSTVGRRLVQQMHGWDAELVFGLKSQTLDALFRRARDRAGLAGFTFHDARHTAATRMGRQNRIHALEMCKIFGWTNPKMALTYFNPTASDLAAKLG